MVEKNILEVQVIIIRRSAAKVFVRPTVKKYRILGLQRLIYNFLLFFLFFRHQKKHTINASKNNNPSAYFR